MHRQKVDTIKIEEMTDGIQEQIIEDFSLFDNKNNRYNYIIELGKALPPISEEGMKDENLIKGCQSKVWLNASFEEENIVFEADSDSTLVKGLVSLLVKVFSHRKSEDIINLEPYFMEKIGLKQMLSMNRANGLAAMVKQIKFYALAMQAKA